MAKSKKSTPQKTVLQQMPSMSTVEALRAGLQVTSVCVRTGGGRERHEELQVIKAISFRVKKIGFEIKTGIDHKRKMLVIDACEINDGVPYKLHAIRFTQKIDRLDQKPTKYEWYSKAVKEIKEAIKMYSASPEAQLERDVWAGKYSPGEQLQERMRLWGISKP